MPARGKMGSYLLSHFLLLLAWYCQSAMGQTITQWLITQYEIEVMTTSVGEIDTSLTFTDTTTLRLYPPVPTSLAPTNSPTSSDTSSDESYNALYKTLYIPASAVASSDLSSISSYLSSSSLVEGVAITDFIVQKVYTAPLTCPSSFVFTTTSQVFVPLGAETQMPTPTSATTSLTASITYVTNYIQGPFVGPSGGIGGSTSDFVQTEYIDQCSKPYALPTGPYTYGYPSVTTDGLYPTYTGGLRSGGDDYYGDYNPNCLGSLCPFWLIYIVVIVPVIGLLFLGGLLESYFWFQRLMKGQYALRGVPLLWVAISLWTLLCLRRKRPASQEYRPQLQKQWHEMSTGQHIGLWFKYGFRHRDPPEYARIVGVLPNEMANGWGPQPPPQQAYYGPPPGGPGPGPGSLPPMQQQSPYYPQQPYHQQQQQQSPQMWQGQYPPQQQPYPYAAPYNQQQGQWPGMHDQTKSMAMTSEAPSPSMGTGPLGTTGHESRHYSATSYPPGSPPGIAESDTTVPGQAGTAAPGSPHGTPAVIHEQHPMSDTKDHPQT